MILVLPTQTEKEARSELNAIREAGEYIVASADRRREFLEQLGFGDGRKKEVRLPRKTNAKVPKRSA
jgi:hypothetical protein